MVDNPPLAIAPAGVQDVRGVRLRVTAIIPAYNSEETIERALNSALAQTYRPLEILVIDDCSRDSTAQIVETYAERGVKLLRLCEQQGASGARNAGIHAASGDLIAFLNSDNEWLPSKLDKQVALVASDENYVFVSCASRHISPEGEDLGDLYQGRRPVIGPDCWKSLLASNTIATPSVLVWRRHLVDLGGFNQRLKNCEDQDMWIRLAARGSVGYVDESLVRVHSRANSLSSNLGVALLRVALDVVERNIAEQRSRLSVAEIRRILGQRLEWLGRAECNDNYIRGLPVILKSAVMGYRPLQTGLFLVSASPPARWLKERVRARNRSAVARNGAAAAGAETFTGPVDRAVRHPMLPVNEADIVRFLPDDRPRLVVIVDAEEEFDWRQPISRHNFSVQTMAAQVHAQQIYRRFGVIPSYAVDYPIVMHEGGYRPMMEMLQAGTCELGAQLHTWVTPPHEEEVCEENSYAGNLSGDLELRKLETLVDAIERRFGIRSPLYRAGRYGTGKNTAAILERLGFDIDCSVVPGASRGSPHAPDYSGGTPHPYWLRANRPILELPVTVATVGLARRFGEDFYLKITSDTAIRFRLPGIMARTGLLNRIRLSPEGNPLEESKHLTRCLVADGHRFFAVSYHSPSLVPGNTPYVRNRNDLARFLAWIEGYLEFFFDEMGGIADTPRGIHAWALAHSALAAAQPSAALAAKDAAGREVSAPHAR